MKKMNLKKSLTLTASAALALSIPAGGGAKSAEVDFLLLTLSLFAVASPAQEHRCLPDSKTDISAPISERMNNADNSVIPVTVAIRLIWASYWRLRRKSSASVSAMGFADEIHMGFCVGHFEFLFR